MSVVVGERIVAARRAANVTAADLAESLDVHTNTVSNYERGKTDLPVSVLFKIAKLLDVSPVYLLGLTDDRTEAVPQARLPRTGYVLDMGFVEEVRAARFLDAVADPLRVYALRLTPHCEVVTTREAMRVSAEVQEKLGQLAEAEPY